MRCEVPELHHQRYRYALLPDAGKKTLRGQDPGESTFVVCGGTQLPRDDSWLWSSRAVDRYRSNPWQDFASAELDEFWLTV